ncbi:hypothetical protein CHARACLAT_027138 [Characodon lateralis]|uniref:Uncharacterized protein n=1 Tax=Characodon lateralis TaxID=208331 RepID=A0ABU7DVV6_9TELE|nr:hypothetical protein [Characodon lateralis]
MSYGATWSSKEVQASCESSHSSSDGGDLYGNSHEHYIPLTQEQFGSTDDCESLIILCNPPRAAPNSIAFTSANAMETTLLYVCFHKHELHTETGLKEEAGVPGENPSHANSMQKDPRLGVEPTPSLLQGNSAPNCTTVQTGN